MGLFAFLQEMEAGLKVPSFCWGFGGGLRLLGCSVLAVVADISRLFAAILWWIFAGVLQRGVILEKILLKYPLLKQDLNKISV